MSAVGDDGCRYQAGPQHPRARRMGKAPSVHSPEGMAERSVRN
jgi:hypothetical protein